MRNIEPDYKEEAFLEIKDRSEEMNGSLWYVNPNDIKEAMDKLEKQFKEEQKRNLIGKVALFGAMLMQHDIIGEEKEKLKRLMMDSLKLNRKEI